MHLEEGGHPTHAHEEDGHDHGHGHGHGHGHAHRGGHAAHLVGKRGEEGTERWKLLGTLALTSVVMLAEAVGGYFAKSDALLSDAGHMLTDVVALLLAMLAQVFASRPADLKRTYGFFRLEILSALINGLSLLVIAVLVVARAWHHLFDAPEINHALMLGIAVIGLIANLGGIVLLSQSHSLNMRGAFLHIVGDALSSVGVIVAAAIAWSTGFHAADPIVAILIAVIIAFGSVNLVREAVHVLLEAVPAHIDLTQVFKAITAVDGIREVHDLHVWTIAHSMHALSAHLVVAGDGKVEHNDQILTRVKAMLKSRFGIDHTTLQIETEKYAHVGEVH